MQSGPDERKSLKRAINPTNYATAVSSHSSNLPVDTNTYCTRQQMIVYTGSARGMNIQTSDKTI